MLSSDELISRMDTIDANAEKAGKLVEDLSYVVLTSIAQRRDLGLGFDDPVPSKYKDTMSSLRPISQLQEHALWAKNYVDVDQYDAKVKLMSTVKDSETFEYVSDGYGSSLDVFQDNMNQCKLRACDNEYKRYGLHDFSEYGSLVLDSYGSFPKSSKFAFNLKLSEAVNKTYTDAAEKVGINVYDSNNQRDLDYLKLYAGSNVNAEYSAAVKENQNALFDKMRCMHTVNLSQKGRNDLEQSMRTVFQPSMYVDWMAYAADNKLQRGKLESSAQHVPMQSVSFEQVQEGGYDYGDG